MTYNPNSGFGAGQLAAADHTTGKIFVVAATDDVSQASLTGVYLDDPEGVARLLPSFTLALANCVAGRGDVIFVSPEFETALTAGELLIAETKGVRIIQSNSNKNGEITVHRATGVLAQTADLSLFTITGRVELVSIMGTVTTVVESQTNATLLKMNPTVGADVDICAAFDIDGGPVGAVFSITGTLATAMVATVSGAAVKQADSLILEAGLLELECAASNTGSIKWTVVYKPVDPGARMFAA